MAGLRSVLVGSALLLAAGLAGCASPARHRHAVQPDDRDSADESGDSGCVPRPEVWYDGVDQDCDGADLTDADGDGDDALAVPGGTDCDDRDPAVSPGTPELCDGLDQDCDGLIDEDIVPMWYRDGDGDGYGAPYESVCDAAAGYVLDATDCDDVHATIHPGALERCDETDDDCDGDLDADDDADGQGRCSGDCDDAQPRSAPGNAELCGDGIDNDCDGSTDTGCVDDICEWTVPTEVSTIQGALDAASDGDTICVEPGTYAEYLNFGGKAVALVGLGGSSTTVLTPGPDWYGVSFVSGEGRTTVMEGFTIEGGGHVEIGGSSPTFVDVVVQDVWDWSGVGAIYAEDGDPAFWDVVIRDSTASYGPKNEGFGGGMYLRSTHAALDRVLIEDCKAGSSGGGIEAGGGTLGMSNVVLRGNVAGGSWGAGAGGLQAYNITLRLVNVRFVDNVASISWDTPPPGGAIGLKSSELIATNVTICDNGANSTGGGLYVDASTATLVNTIICENVAGSGGGGIQSQSGSVTLRYSDVWGNTPDDFVGMADPTGTDGNVSADPLFSDDDRHLDPSSPLVDAGDPSLLDADGSRSDMGAWGGPGGAGW